jgi:hypothetical protein
MIHVFVCVPPVALCCDDLAQVMTPWRGERVYPTTLSPACTSRLVVQGAVAGAQCMAPCTDPSARAAVLVTGPVVGVVTATSAIVLVEVSAGSEVSVVLLDPLSQHCVRQSQVLRRGRPSAFLLDSLRPSTRYEVGMPLPPRLL